MKNNEPRDPASLLDDLACGELDEASRTRLIEWLDADPLRWRRCALVFMESQLWSEGCGMLLPTRLAANSLEPTITKPIPLMRPRRPWWAFLVSISAAFLLGLGAASFRPGLSPVAHHDRSSAPQPGSAVPKTHGNNRISPDRETDPGVEEPTHFLTIRTDGDAVVQLPVVETAGQLPSSISQPPPIPERMRHQFQRLGYELIPSRRLVPINVGTGKQLVIPVDEYQVKYVGNEQS